MIITKGIQAMDKKFNKNFSSAMLILIVSLFASSILYSAEESFNVNMRILDPVKITEQRSLSFPDHVVGTQANIVVNPSDATSASFSATGAPNANIKTSVVESYIILSDGANNNIEVDTFNIISEDSFDSNGELNNISIGATAHVEAGDPVGNYNGFATLRIIYQ